ncbi:Uncharacterised protein [Mycobacteroides abscessus subsp. abscessus]|nr:Uncharacterised protein [Mycobacteroides abscessus subsp. abscessus]
MGMLLRRHRKPIKVVKDVEVKKEEPKKETKKKKVK